MGKAIAQTGVEIALPGMQHLIWNGTKSDVAKGLAYKDTEKNFFTPVP
ncbi:MAG TPA: hypothetical protein VJ959_15700 [Desulfotignum sp.]|nr:hypothetical protein [Desulfotignum sp.]